jgi:mannitol/fructose-specific phosphotransferase system IIA component (Ntr-type)
MKKPEISAARCAAHLSRSSAEDVLAEAAARVAPDLGLPVATIQAALARRESLGSTGLAHGVALPHCSLPEAPHFWIGVITLEGPIDFGALDGKPSDIFVFIVGPEARRTDHVRILAGLTARLREEGFRDSLRRAASAEELAALFGGAVLPDPSENAAASLVIINVQDDRHYEAILETVSGETGASVSVSTAQSAGSILHRLPLFATFWNDQESREVRRIEVVLPRDRVNKTIRRVEEIAEGPSGVQIGVIDLSYSSGTLEL